MNSDLMSKYEKEAARLEAQFEHPDAAKLPEYQLLSHQKLLDLPIDPLQWIMNLMIPYPGLVAISGRPGSYKTFFALWLGLRASGGHALFEKYEKGYFCDVFPDQKMGNIPTLFIEEENTKQTMKQRALGFKPFETGEMHYMIEEGFRFVDDPWRLEILKIIEEKGIKLLIVDPFSSVMGLENENDNAQVAKVMDLVRKEFVKKGITVILIHHPSKGDGDGKSLRGAGDILGKCDVHLCLEVDDKDNRMVTVTYQKMRVADRSLLTDFKIRLMGQAETRDLSFSYLGPAVSKTEEEREELARVILENMNGDDEYTQADIASLVGQKAQNKKFQGAWKSLIDTKRIYQDTMTKKYCKFILHLKSQKQQPS